MIGVWFPLSCGKDKFALVDRELYEEVVKYVWSQHSNGYVYRNIYIGNRKCIPESLHEFVMFTRVKEYSGDIDHKNTYPLDCRWENLRPATRSQNMANTPTRKGKKYKGITKANSKWAAQITVNYKHKYLGVYDTEDEAALAYNKAALEYFGEFAYLNKVEKNPEGMKEI